MIDPQSLDLSALPWIPLDATAGFPAKPGIYFAIDSNGVIQYIGRSKDVRTRWKNHHRFDDLQAIGGIKIAYLFFDAPELLPEIESALIAWFDPPLNITQGNPERSTTGRIEIRLRQLRKSKNLSQVDLACCASMSLANIQKIEYGKIKSIPFDTLEKLCLILGCDPGDLLTLRREEGDG